jgi:hypothetical protein
MRILSVSLAVMALALSAGCAQKTRSSEMGAGPAAGATASSDARRVYCRDGAWVPTTALCGTHGGVERDMSASTPK